MGQSVRDYSFQAKLVVATGIAASPDIAEILRNNLPSILAVEKAEVTDDRSGTDYWAYRMGLPPLSIDCKIRDIDPTLFQQPADDLALETWSVVDKKVGWALDPMKRSDYILWFFRPTKRWVLIPFPLLQSIFVANRERWFQEYRHARQSTNKGQWQSECLFVPRLTIWRALYERYGGRLRE